MRQGAHQDLAGHLQALGSGRAVLKAPHAFLLARAGRCSVTLVRQCPCSWEPEQAWGGWGKPESVLGSIPFLVLDVDGALMLVL